MKPWTLQIRMTTRLCIIKLAEELNMYIYVHIFRGAKMCISETATKFRR